MRKSRFSEEQIIAILAEQERGLATAEVCRKHGVSSATFYKWKAKFGGMDVSDARRLKTLETENARLKRKRPVSAALRRLRLGEILRRVDKVNVSIVTMMDTIGAGLLHENERSAVLVGCGEAAHHGRGADIRTVDLGGGASERSERQSAVHLAAGSAPFGVA